MKLKHIAKAISLPICLGVSGMSSAEGYQWQVDLMNDNSESDVSKIEIDVTVLAAAYYYQRVSTSKGAWAEAEFLSRSSNVYAGIADVEINDNLNGGGLTGDGMLIGGVYYIPNSNVFVGLDILRITVDGMVAMGGGSSDDIENDTLTVGTYLDDRSSIAFAYETGMQFGPDTSAMELSYKNLLKVGSNDLNVEASFRSDELDSTPSQTNNTVAVSADYYVNNQLGIGAGYSTNSGDLLEDEGTTTSIRVSYFFNPMFALEVEASNFSVDVADPPNNQEDESTLVITASGRF